MLIVEDGTGLPDSNSYASLEEFKAYHLARGNDIILLTDEVIEALLIKASDYIDTSFQFLGNKLEAEQAMSFPRYGEEFYPATQNFYALVPKKLKNATCSLALILSTTEAFSDITTTKREKTKVDVIETEKEYFEPKKLAERFPQVNLLLREFISQNRVLFP